MPKHFSEPVRRVLHAAAADATRQDHSFVCTCHILGAVAADTSGYAELEHHGVMPAAVQFELDRLLSTGDLPELRMLAAPRKRRSGSIPLSTDATKAIDRAILATGSGRQLELEHLLLGLIGHTRGAASTVLRGLGVSIDAPVSAHGSARAAAPARFTVQIDDASDRSIREQIISQITEAVATGDLQPGDRLPSVRELADQCDVAPGTVAKAYVELEQSGVLETQGARGTRVSLRAQHAPSAERLDTLVGLLRPIVVAAYHLGATSDEARSALEIALDGVLLN